MDFFFDYTCPYAYLAFTELERYEAASGTRVTLKPMLLGGVFAALGTPQRLFETLSPAKAAHNAADMSRYAALFGVKLIMPAAHPMRSVEALRATLATRLEGGAIDRRVVRGFYDAYWVRSEPPSAEPTLRRVLGEAGHDADAALARIQMAELKGELRALTDEAIGHGVFGAPAFVRDGELYWGQDRLSFAFRTADLSAADRQAHPTMPHTLDFYWDFSSPYAYLAATQVESLVGRTGATLRERPMLLGGLFKAVGQVDVPLLAFPESKRAYMLHDLTRWAAHWDVPFRFPTRFPMNTVKALRCYLALPEARRSAFRAAVFRAYWAEDRDISDEAVLGDLLGEGAPAILDRIKSDASLKQALFDATAKAVSAGVFGAPTFVVDDKELFWGQDRMQLVERALRT